MTNTTEIETYWAGNRIWSPLAEVLHDIIEAKLVPGTGGLASAENYRLERFRRAKNVYRDICQNGGCNYTKAQIRSALGVWLSKKFYGSDGFLDFDAVSGVVEPIMDRFVIAAAKEQDVYNDEHMLYDVLKTTAAGPLRSANIKHLKNSAPFQVGDEVLFVLETDDIGPHLGGAEVLAVDSDGQTLTHDNLTHSNMGTPGRLALEDAWHTMDEAGLAIGNRLRRQAFKLRLEANDKIRRARIFETKSV